VPLNDPIDFALVGAGTRATLVYQPLIRSLAPWLRLTAVVDPRLEHAQALAAPFGVPAYGSLSQLVKDRPMEAAVVVAPVEAHHSTSVYLSSHGIHNLVETTIASTLLQARDMVAAAERNHVVFRVGENFVRFPIDRIARKIMDDGVLGPVKRVNCVNDHTGYHNSSRWVSFFGTPIAVNAIDHTMPTARHTEAAHRIHTTEHFSARHYWFPEDRLVTDTAGGHKGLLGRLPRPGYTEFAGARGTIVYEQVDRWRGRGLVKYCTDEALERDGIADETTPIVDNIVDDVWTSTSVDLSTGRIEYVNPLRDDPTERPMESTGHSRPWYWVAVMDHLVDFANTVRGQGSDLYTERHALEAMELEVGAGESMLRDGARVTFPLPDETAFEAKVIDGLRQRFDVDPLDIEAMMAISYPRP
jgi:predicted dehydrogenase